MPTKEQLLKAAGTLTIVLVALAIHQKFVAPMLVSKPATKVGG